VGLLHSPALAYSDAELIDGFNRTVFGAEYAGSGFGNSYLRKFVKKVRFFIEPGGSSDQRSDVKKFIGSLPRLIENLDAELVTNRNNANFIIHLVHRRDYVKTARTKIFRRKNASVFGRCMVRSVFSRGRISKSDALIVIDEGKELFSRCMTEEILQGLGPLKDDPSLKHSMFNDTSKFTSFRRFDRLLLNILYDKRIRPGASQSRVQNILPVVTRSVQKRISER